MHAEQKIALLWIQPIHEGEKPICLTGSSKGWLLPKGARARSRRGAMRGCAITSWPQSCRVCSQQALPRALTGSSDAPRHGKQSNRVRIPKQDTVRSKSRQGLIVLLQVSSSVFNVQSVRHYLDTRGYWISSRGLKQHPFFYLSVQRSLFSVWGQTFLHHES